MRKFETIYCGFGPATIFSFLSNRPSNSLIIEKGRSLKFRTRKEVVFGSGGAGCFSDSKLVVNPLVGGRILDILPNIDFYDYAEIVLFYYNMFHEGSFLDWKYPNEYEIPSKILKLLKSKLCHVGTDNGKIIFLNMEEYICKTTPIQFEEEVVDILKGKEGFLVVTDKAKYWANKVVIATGTRDKLVTKLKERFQLESEPNKLQIGVRVEVPNKYFSDLVEKFYDFKIVQNTKLGRWRTFCINSGTAYVTVERDSQYVSANGHAYSNKPSTGLTNFGILGELNISLTKTEQIKLVQTINGGFDSLLGQNIDDFICRRTTYKLKHASSLKVGEYHLGNLWARMPLKEVAQELKEYIIELKKHFEFEGHFFAPEINLTNPRVRINEKFEIYPGIYVIGDAGITRSIIQAGISGILLSKILRGYEL